LHHASAFFVAVDNAYDVPRGVPWRRYTNLPRENFKLDNHNAAAYRDKASAGGIIFMIGLLSLVRGRDPYVIAHIFPHDISEHIS
jgi:hypothetical protein